MTLTFDDFQRRADTRSPDDVTVNDMEVRIDKIAKIFMGVAGEQASMMMQLLWVKDRIGSMESSRLADREGDSVSAAMLSIDEDQSSVLRARKIIGAGDHIDQSELNVEIKRVHRNIELSKLALEAITYISNRSVPSYKIGKLPIKRNSNISSQPSDSLVSAVFAKISEGLDVRGENEKSTSVLSSRLKGDIRTQVIELAQKRGFEIPAPKVQMAA